MRTGHTSHIGQTPHAAIGRRTLLRSARPDPVESHRDDPAREPSAPGRPRTSRPTAREARQAAASVLRLERSAENTTAISSATGKQ